MLNPVVVQDGHVGSEVKSVMRVQIDVFGKQIMRETFEEYLECIVNCLHTGGSFSNLSQSIHALSCFSLCSSWRV